MRYLMLLPLLILGGCSKVTELNDNVSWTTEVIMQNVSSVEQSTQEIRRNTENIRESTRAMKENLEHMERLKNS